MFNKPEYLASKKYSFAVKVFTVQSFEKIIIVMQ
jgi:hypothetical protein